MSKKTERNYLNNYVKDFTKILENINPSMHAYETFSDWLVMAAAALYSWKKNPEVEEEYSKAAARYTPEELEKHGQLLAITTQALEESPGDFLGEVFTMAELTNDRNGQFFTPYCVSSMMAKMMIGALPTDHVCRINDPACGAGGMMVAAAMELRDRNYDYQHDAYFVGQDIDHRCARMAFIQMTLLGIPALIICGNTLTLETYWQRETIGYHMAGMDFRLRIERMRNIIRTITPQGETPETPQGETPETPQGETPEAAPEDNTPEPAAPVSMLADIELKREYVQGELF